ncbi:Adenylosuccinate synthetase [Paenibacillus konkukensis]|uniref:Adenylosuccinate synthetase n=1 Tax=Paenibacillus konkukensis TaxID=2020716 RepID=A0ABY4RL75_9BACL|nr:adenylosuccinate synthase [Paenibacillus konkukensis]UQZ82863.1 Adenylosuccinate synthetase [Paenibacillus konkukensis]
MKGSVTAVVGANWGDEGKGKVTDLLAAQADVVVRFQGGNNAGHTIINDYGKFVLHMLPSGVFHRRIVNVIGPGTALNVRGLLEEYEKLQARNVPEPILRISERSQVVLPYHELFDSLEEERLGSRQFGSTRSGIAPFYADKYLKIGIQVADLYDRSTLLAKLGHALESKNVLLEHLYGQEPLQAEPLAERLLQDGEAIRPLVCDTTELLHEALQEGKTILVEGQLGALRDPDHGIYPYSTSSSTLAGYAAVGAGVPPHAIRRIIAVAKAYSSCVGAGPFVTELHGPEGDELRRRGGDGGEFGSKTGRPRRVGWFDAVATRYGCMAQGATEVTLSLLDVLGYLDRIPVCTAYEVDGQRTERFPAGALLEKAVPVYEYLPGWKCDITGITDYDKLPEPAKRYVDFLERRIGVPIRSISTGPRREHFIERR